MWFDLESDCAKTIRGCGSTWASLLPGQGGLENLRFEREPAIRDDLLSLLHTLSHLKPAVACLPQDHPSFGIHSIVLRHEYDCLTCDALHGAWRDGQSGGSGLSLRGDDGRGKHA